MIDARGSEDQQVPLPGHDVRRGDADLGDGRQLAAEVLEDVLEHRDQEGHEREHTERAKTPIITG